MGTIVANNDDLLEVEVNLNFYHDLDIKWETELENKASEVFKKAADDYVREKTPGLSGTLFKKTNSNYTPCFTFAPSTSKFRQKKAEMQKKQKCYIF